MTLQIYRQAGRSFFCAGRVGFRKFWLFCTLLQMRIMARYFIELSYNGAAYNGWQRQPNAPSVQETLEEGLSRLLGAPQEVVGASGEGRGVKACSAGWPLDP